MEVKRTTVSLPPLIHEMKGGKQVMVTTLIAQRDEVDNITGVDLHAFHLGVSQEGSLVSISDPDARINRIVKSDGSTISPQTRIPVFIFSPQSPKQR